MRTSRMWIVLALGLVVGVAGCSKEEEEEVMCDSITFAPALTSPGAGDVYLDAPLNTCTSLYLNVLINDLSGIWTVSFDLSYPSSVVQFSSCTVGPLLNKQNPSTTPTCVATVNSPGHLTVSLTRWGSDPSVTAGPAEVVATLQFQKVSTGSSAIDFETGPSAPGAEAVQDENSNLRPATFSPGHGGLVSVP